LPFLWKQIWFLLFAPKSDSMRDPHCFRSHDRNNSYIY
jgi:hypothetical protein